MDSYYENISFTEAVSEDIDLWKVKITSLDSRLKKRPYLGGWGWGNSHRLSGLREQLWAPCIDTCQLQIYDALVLVLRESENLCRL